MKPEPIPDEILASLTARATSCPNGHQLVWLTGRVAACYSVLDTKTACEGVWIVHGGGLIPHLDRVAETLAETLLPTRNGQQLEALARLKPHSSLRYVLAPPHASQSS